MQNRELKILNVILAYIYIYTYSGFMFTVLKGHDKPISTEDKRFAAVFTVTKHSGLDESRCINHLLVTHG